MPWESNNDMLVKDTPVLGRVSQPCPSSRFVRLRFFVLLCLVYTLLSQARAIDREAQRPTAKEFASRYLSIPLVFEPTEAIIADHPGFVSRNVGTTILLQDDRVTIAVPEHRQAGAVPSSPEFSLVQMKFLGSSSSTLLSGENELSSKSNYLIGNDRSRWRTGIANYQRVQYHSLYRGIDLVFYGNHQALEHDFVLAPGSDPKQIQIAFQGQTRLHLAKNGDLILNTQTGELVLKRPVIYQEIDKRSVAVSGGYVVHGNSAGFWVGAYDHHASLVIDPILTYGTYLAGSSSEEGAAIAVDSSGNAYVTGYTFSSDFPATNSLQCQNCSANPHAFVTKLNTTGTGLVYSTLVGGSKYDQPASIAVDPAGNAVISGRTQSPDFPTVNPIQGWGGSNAVTEGFVASLNATGSAFNYSTYLGGKNGSFIGPVTVDQNGNAYVAGTTDSPDFPVTPGTLPAITPNYPNFELFVAKISPAGGLGFGVLIQGNGPSSNSWANHFSVTGIAVDSSGDAFITGGATVGFPTTNGAYQISSRANPNSQSTNAYVAKLNPTASAFVYATYIGGSGSDVSSGIALDVQGNAYIAGSTSSKDYPVTNGAFQTSLTNCCGSFVTKLDPTGSSLVYSTFLFNEYQGAMGIAVDPSGAAYVTGLTHGGISIVNPLQSILPVTGFPAPSIFLSKLDPSGSTLAFSSYYGGTTGSRGNAVAVDSAGNAYITGATFDTDLPTTVGAFQRSVQPPPPFVQQGHVFVAKIDINTPASSVCFSPTVLNFGNQRVATTSPTRYLTLTNCGNAPLTNINPTASGDFSVTSNSCTVALSPGEQCQLGANFHPSVFGSISGALQIADNAGLSPQKIQLSGFGALPAVGLSTTAVLFDDQLVGQTGLPVFIVLQNSGSADLHISSINISGDFARQTDCPAVLHPANSCSINVTFTPTAPGTRTGAITITDDAANSPQTVTLTGKGLTSYPVPTVLSLNPDSVAAGSGGFMLVVSGSGFFQTSVVRWNGADRPTTYYGNGYLQASISAADIAQMGQAKVTVFNPTPGGGETQPTVFTIYEKLGFAVKDIIYNPHDGLIYASIPNSSTSNPNTVVSLDPSTGVFGTFIPVGTDPAKLALSDDGEFLYVGLNGENSIRRVVLASGVPDIKFSLGSDPTYGVYNAQDIQVIPGSPHSIAVARVFPHGDPNSGGIAIYDDAVKRPAELSHQDTFGDFSGHALRFAGDPFKLYLVTSPFFFRLSIDASGVHKVDSTLNLATGDIESDGTLLYFTSGKIVDPTIPSVVASYKLPLGFEASVRPDTPGSRTFFLSLPPTSILGYDQGSFAQTDAIGLSSLNGESSDLLRWGAAGFAFLNDDFTLPASQIILLRTGFGALPDYSLNITNPVVTVFPSQTATFNGTLTGMNGYSYSVNLSCFNAPVGCNFSPGAAVTPSANGTAITLALNTTLSTAVQDYAFSLRGSATDHAATAHAQPLKLSVVDYAIAAPSPTSISVAQGNPSAPVTFLVSALGSFNGSVNLSCDPMALPSGATCSFYPSAVVSPRFGNPVTVSLVVNAGSAAVTSSQMVNILAISAGDPRPPQSSAFQLAITAGTGTADLAVTLSHAPATSPILLGQSINYTVSAQNNIASSSVAAQLTVEFSSSVQVRNLSDSCSAASGVVSCSFTSTNGTLNTFSFTVQPGSVHDLVATAIVSSSALDSNPIDNTVQDVTHFRFRPFARLGLPVWSN